MPDKTSGKKTAPGCQNLLGKASQRAPEGIKQQEGQESFATNSTQPATNPAANIHWTKPALEEVQTLEGERYNGDPKGWHERKVLAYTKKRGITGRVNIRKPAHSGTEGNPNDPEHITVSCKKVKNEARHVYTEDSDGAA